MQAGRAVMIVVAIVLAIMMFDAGVTQGRLDVGGTIWATGYLTWVFPFTLGLVTLVALAVVAVVRRGEPGPLRRGLRDALVLGVVALWLGFGAGWATAWVQGPTVVRQGTVVFDLGSTVSASLRSNGACVSVVGDGDLIAEFRPDDTDLPVVWIRAPFDRNEYPTLAPNAGQDSLRIPGGVPTWIGPYDWSSGRVQEGSDGGAMSVSGVRQMDGTGPGSLDVLVTWRCGAVAPLE